MHVENAFPNNHFCLKIEILAYKTPKVSYDHFQFKLRVFM